MAARLIRSLHFLPSHQPFPVSPPPPSLPPHPSSRQLSSSCSADDGEDDALVADVASILTNQRSRSRWGFLRSLYGPSGGFTPAQAARITLRLRSNPRLALCFFRWSEASSLCHHDLPSYAAITHVLARARLRSAAQSLIRSAIMHASGSCNGGENAPLDVLAVLARTYRVFDSAPLVFDLLVRACLQARRVEQAVEIIRRLRRKGFSLAVGTCNELIRAVSKGEGAEAGFHLYEELFVSGDGDARAPPRWRVSPNVHTFNALLLTSYREGRSVDADRIRREMDKFACHPNCFTYSILMGGLCEAGRVQEARVLWEEMAAKGIKPDVTSYNTLIGGFCWAGEMERAEELFREMVLGGIEPTGTSYERLIGGYCSTGDVDYAVLLFAEMRRKHFSADVSTVGELIRELCKEGSVVKALGVLRGEMGRVGFFPSREMFVCLIRGFCRDGQVEEGLQLQKEMAGKGFEPNFEVYNAFVEACLERGDFGEAARLKDEMVKMGLQEGLKEAAVDEEAL